MDCEEERLIHWEDVLDYSGDKKRLLQQTAKYRSNDKAPKSPPPPPPPPPTTDKKKKRQIN